MEGEKISSYVKRKLSLVLGDNEDIMKGIRLKKKHYLNSINPSFISRRVHASIADTKWPFREKLGPIKRHSRLTIFTAWPKELLTRNNRYAGRRATTNGDRKYSLRQDYFAKRSRSTDRESASEQRSRNKDIEGVVDSVSSTAPEAQKKECCYTGIHTWVGTPTWLPPIHRQHVTKPQHRDYFTVKSIPIIPLDEVIKSRYLRTPVRKRATRSSGSQMDFGRSE